MAMGKKSPGLVIAFGKGSPKGEPDEGESMAKEEAGKELASALGVTGDVDGKAVCEAVQTIMDLGYSSEGETEDYEEEEE